MSTDLPGTFWWLATATNIITLLAISNCLIAIILLTLSAHVWRHWNDRR